MKPKDYIKAMTTGRWPPKPEEEMSMSPGAERALMRVAELMPSFVKSIESLASAMRPQPLNDEVALTICLTPVEWCEVVNAVSVRSLHLKEDSQPDDDMTEEQIKEWIVTLDHAYDKMTKVLTLNHLTY